VVYVFDSAGIKRAAITGQGRPGGTYGALPRVGIAVNQANGHVLVFDEGEAKVDEFEATGPFVSQISHSLASAEPSAVAVDPSEGASAQRVYVTSGSGVGSEVFAFGPLPTPTHRELPTLEPKASETTAGEFKGVCGTAVDSQGDLYVASSGTTSISVFVPEGNGFRYVTSIADNHGACNLAVDSKGNLYASHSLSGGLSTNTVVEFPLTSAYPFAGATPIYGAPVTIDGPGSEPPNGIAVDPANDHVFVARDREILEYNSAANGSGLLKSGIGSTLTAKEFFGLAVYGETGDLYVANNGASGIIGNGVDIIDPATNELLVLINGNNGGISKVPGGALSGGFVRAEVAVDQSNGHVYVNNPQSISNDVYEFEASGAYVSRLNRNVPSLGWPAVAVDNAGGAHSRTIFVAGGQNGPPEVNAYSPAEYGEPPTAVTQPVTGADGRNGAVVLDGVVTPSGVPVTSCEFEYVAKSRVEFEGSGFAGASVASCAESELEIGSGFAPVPVHAAVTGLSGSQRYYYRLVAENQFGPEVGPSRRFGSPEITTEPASEVLYTEAAVNATVDPVGLTTNYHCDYGPTMAYGTATPEETLVGEASAQAHCALVALRQSVTYHFRVVAQNAWGSTDGEDRTFTTLAEAGKGSCPNEAFRAGPSSALPNCRAYELVSPNLNSMLPFDLREGEPADPFAGPLVSPNGENVIYYGEGTPPGSEGNGKNAYLATRTSTGGWVNTFVGPTGAESPEVFAGGTTPSHSYAFWVALAGISGGTLAEGHYLRSPEGSFQPIGLGEESAVDLAARGRFISEGGGHVIFTSKVPLAAGAPPAGVEAIYDRPGGGTGQLISAPPPGASPAVVQEFDEGSAFFEGSSADGSAVAFVVGTTLYVHRNGETMTVTTGTVANTGPETTEGDLAFAGLSADGSRLFYLKLPTSATFTELQRGEVLVYNTNTEATETVGSGDESVVVNVSSDGSHVYFASNLVMGGRNAEGQEAQAANENLYVWSSDTGTSFIATVEDTDFEPGGGGHGEARGLGYWTQGLGPALAVGVGPALDTSRSTADGNALTFESFAEIPAIAADGNVVAYPNEGKREVYLFGSDGRLRCVSCNYGNPATDGATLQSVAGRGESPLTLAPSNALTVIPNLSAGGSTVFFETTESLVPQDQNGERDVYEWREGIISLLSTGRSNGPSFLLGASVSGRDVFIVTFQSLVPADNDGGAESIYDVREGGGVPSPSAEEPCQGDACRAGLTMPPPTLAAPGSSLLQGPGNQPTTRHCPAGKHARRSGGRTRCVPNNKHKSHHKHHKSHHKHHKRVSRGGKGS
jgi:hypothetical protein